LENRDMGKEKEQSEDKEFKKLQSVALALIEGYENNTIKVRDVKLLRATVEKMLVLKPEARIIFGEKSIKLRDFLIAIRKEEVILDALIKEAKTLAKKLKKNKISNAKLERLYYLINEIRARSPSEYKANPELHEAMIKIKELLQQ